MKITSTLFKTVSMITLFTIITRILGFLFRIFLSRKLGAEGIGIYQIASSIIGVFMTLVASGLPLTTAKMVARYNTEPQKQHIITTSACAIAIIISIISGMLLLLGESGLSLIIKNNLVVNLVLIMSPALIFSAIYAVFRGSLWGKNSFFWVSFTELLEQIIRILLTLFVVKNMTNMISSAKQVALTFSITCLISCMVVTFVYFFTGGRLVFKKHSYITILKSSTPITCIRIASSFIQPLTALLIPLLLTRVGFSSSEAIASYGIIMGMSFPLLFAPLSIIGSLSMVLIPKISSLDSDNNVLQIKNSIEKSINFSLFLGVVFVPLFLSCGDMMGLFLYNNLDAGVYIQLASICIIPMILNNISSSILNALNMEIKSFVNYIYGVVILLISLCTFTFFIKENAIILSYFLSTMLTAFLNIRLICKKVNNLNFNLAPLLLKYSLIMLPTSILGHFVSNIFYRFLPIFFAGFLGGSFAILATILLIQVFNLYDIKSFVNKKHQRN